MSERSHGYLLWLAVGGFFVTAVLLQPEKQDLTKPDEYSDVSGLVLPEVTAPTMETPEVRQQNVAPESLRIPILTYHNIRPMPVNVSAQNRQYEVPPEEFERQLAWLDEQGYETISFEALRKSLIDGEPLPSKPVILAFDDGRDTHYSAAFKLLKKYGFTGTFFVFTNAIDRPGYLSWNQMKEMRSAGMEFGSHTRYHAYLTRLTDEVEIEAEIAGSKRTLEEGFGENISALAYPFGLFNDDVIKRIENAGYLTARTINEGFIHTKDDLLKLGSFMPTEDFNRFKRLMERAKM